jgi:hypothetical protein
MKSEKGISAGGSECLTGPGRISLDKEPSSWDAGRWSGTVDPGWLGVAKEEGKDGDGGLRQTDGMAEHPILLRRRMQEHQEL